MDSNISFDVVITGGTVYDGSGGPGVRADVGIVDGVVRAVSSTPLEAGPTTEVVDATGKWVTPGFVDVHTHYDAEVLVGPGLEESVRHGVTTVLLLRAFPVPRSSPRLPTADRRI